MYIKSNLDKQINKIDTLLYNASKNNCDLPVVSESRFISKTCIEVKCSVCGKPATNKLGEEIPYDDPYPNRHNLTAHVCAEHFDMIVRPYSR